MSGSGERFIVGMVGSSGAQTSSQLVLHNKTAECAFGAGPGSQLVRFAQAILQEAESKLGQGQGLSDWRSSYHGGWAGDELLMEGDTLDDALLSAAELQGASFAQHALRDRRDDAMAEEDRPDPVATSVRDKVLLVRPQWKPSFNYRWSVTKGSKPITLFFVDGQYACNLTRLVPERLAYYEQRTKVALYDLLMFRDNSLAAPRDNCELLLMLPDKHTLIHPAKKAAMEEAIAQYEQWANKESLRFQPITDEKEAVRRIARLGV